MSRKILSRGEVMQALAEHHKANIMDFFMNQKVSRENILGAVMFFASSGEDLLKKFITPSDWKALKDYLVRTAKFKPVRRD